MKTGFIATKLAIGAFLVPYIFVYNPAMLLIGTTPFGLIQNLVTACCGMFGAGVAMIGYCQTSMRWWERVWFFVGGLMLIDPGMLTDIIGIAMLASGVLFQLRQKRSEERQLALNGCQLREKPGALGGPLVELSVHLVFASTWRGRCQRIP